jgi:hypothetical protein
MIFFVGKNIANPFYVANSPVFSAKMSRVKQCFVIPDHNKLNLRSLYGNAMFASRKSEAIYEVATSQQIVLYVLKGPHPI